MSEFTLSYFDFPGGRGEDCRLTLHLANADWTDDRVAPKTWPERKPTTPYRSMPVLQVEGKGALAQSNAILAYLGRRFGMHPKDAFEAAQHEAILNAAEDLRTRLWPVLQVKESPARETGRRAFAQGELQTFGAAIEAQLPETGFLGGENPAVADLKLFVLLRWFMNGGVDHIGPEAFEAFPKLKAHYARTLALPRIAEWYAKH